MIVQVVPALRQPKKSVFDYLVPENTGVPAIGSLVSIFFHGRKAVGLVTGISETSDFPINKLQPVQEPLFSGAPIFSEAACGLLLRTAQHYDVPPSLLFMQLLPTFSSRDKFVPKCKAASGNNYSHEVFMTTSLFDPKTYLPRIEALREHHNILILTPTKAHVGFLVKTLQESDIPCVAYDSDQSAKSGRAAWFQGVSDAPSILVTTRSGVLAPLAENGALVIFADEEPSFVQFDAEPNFDARVIARMRARAEQRPLLTISEAPTLAAMHTADTVHYEQWRLTPPILVKLRDERKSGFKGIFADRAIEALTQSYKEKKTSIVCVNRKGSALFLRCFQCYETIQCSACHIAGRVFGEVLQCTHCGKRAPLPTQCPKCSSEKLKARGLTVDSTATEIARLFPGAEIIRLTQDADLQDLKSDAFVIGTEMLLHSLRPAIEDLPIGAIVVPSTEQLLGIGQFTDDEEGFTLLRGLQALAEHHRAPLVLQTYLEGNAAIQALTGDPEVWYANQMKEREEFEYPPFFTIFSLTVPEETSEEEMRTILEKTVPGCIIDKDTKTAYTLRFRNTQELLSETMNVLPKTWHWHILK